MVWTVTVSPLIVTSKPGNKGLGAGWEERRLGQMLAQMDGCWDSGLDKPIKTPKPGKFEDRSTRLNSSHTLASRMPSSA